MVEVGDVSLLVARLIVCAIHPFPGAITVSETYPVIEGLSVLFKKFLESKQKGRFEFLIPLCRH